MGPAAVIEKRQRVVRNQQYLRAPLHSWRLFAGLDATGIQEPIDSWIGHPCLEDSSVHQRSGAGTAQCQVVTHGRCQPPPQNCKAGGNTQVSHLFIEENGPEGDAEGICHPITRVCCRLTALCWLAQAVWGVTA